MKKAYVALILTVCSVAAVFVARGAGDEYAAGVPAHRVLGPADAPVSLVVFSDFQCPACAATEPLLKNLMARHEGRIRLSFRHNPLRMHRWAVHAVQAAEAAGAQGKFWPYHDILFERQRDWAGDQDPLPMFLSYARELGLDEERFRRDVVESRWDGLREADVAVARRNNVRATPTIFINGNRLVGPIQVQADGERLVQEALR